MKNKLAAILNIDEVNKFESQELEKSIDVDDMLKIEDETSFCSKSNIKIIDNRITLCHYKIWY